MDFNDTLDGIVLIVSGILVAAYGSGRLFRSLGIRESIGENRMRVVFVIGLVLVIAGFTSLLWGLFE